jgi:mannose-1-phosphate guanylyltransferase
MSVTNALVLAGGSGTRFWPLSRRSRPKQLLSMVGEGSLLRQSVLRLGPLVACDNVWFSVTADLAGSVALDVPEVAASRCIAEPCARNTAPAILWALLHLPEAARSAPLIVTPSDHWVREPEAFRAALGCAVDEVARHDRILTLGVVPSRPETGYGYLELREARAAQGAAFMLKAFVEKPERTRAEDFVASGRYLWNAGIFVFRPQTLLDRCEELRPELFSGLLSAYQAADPQEAHRRFAVLPAESIDVALMERLEELWTVPLDCGWSDLGSWEALAEVLPRDPHDNATAGNVLTLDASDNVLVADQGTIAVLGIRDLVVVRSADSVLVLPRARAQEVRRLVEMLTERGLEELL